MGSSVLTIIGGALVGGVVLIGILRRKSMKRWGKHDELNEMNINGKIVLITGASAGIGKELAFEMSRRGATVVIPCRTMDRANEAMTDLTKRLEGIPVPGTIVPMVMDMSSLDSVREFVKEFKQKFHHVDILINNAGVYVDYDKEKVTVDGYEYSFGINYLSHFLLTNLLIDHCKKAVNVGVEGGICRIINVSSTYHEKGKLDLDDLNLRNVLPIDYKTTKPYHNSKLAQVYFSFELAKRLSETGIHSYSLCPGWVKTDLGRNINFKWYQWIILVPIAAIFMRTPNQGCQTILHCALGKETGRETGKLYRDCQIWRSSIMPISEKFSADLWKKSSEMVGL